GESRHFGAAGDDDPLFAFDDGVWNNVQFAVAVSQADAAGVHALDDALGSGVAAHNDFVADVKVVITGQEDGGDDVGHECGTAGGHGNTNSRDGAREEVDDAAKAE